MLLTPSTGTPSILNRWMTAADRLGPTLSGFAAYNIAPLAQAMASCGEPLLASQLRRVGPAALCALDFEERSRLVDKTERALSASLRHLLLGETVAMERQVGTEAPLQALIFGRVQSGETAKKILGREFGQQRAAVIVLTSPAQDALSYFVESRHQLLWCHDASRPVQPTASNIRRLPRSASLPPPTDTLWNFGKLSALTLPGHLYSGFASASCIGIEKDDLLRFGALVMERADGRSPFTGTDILLASGQVVTTTHAPLAFFHDESQVPLVRRRQPTHASFVLGDAKERYARIDFDPHERRLSFRIMRAGNRHVVTEGSFHLLKEPLIDGALGGERHFIESQLQEAVLADRPEGTDRREVANYSHRMVSMVLPLSAQYLTWLERHPEAPPAERRERLKTLEEALLAESPKISGQEKPELVRRDWYRIFEAALRAWGASERKDHA